MKVIVCTWDPEHTLARVEAQRRALKDGTIAKMVKEYGKGDALRSAMGRAKLVSHTTSLRGDEICPECGALCDEVYSRDGITEKVAAVRDVAQDFEAAIQRTRRKRLDQ